MLEARKVFKDLLDKFSVETRAGHDEVVKLGGLHIIGTERHESRRIDNQLRGRAGRQGDPGSTQFFISLEDDLMRLFGSDRIGTMVDRLGLKDEDALQAGLLTKQIEGAQRKVEGRNFEIRKNVLEYDNVMNRQREVIYGQRRRVLMGENVKENILGMADKLIEAAIARNCSGEESADWDLAQFKPYIENLCVEHGFLDSHRYLIDNEDREALAEALKEDAHSLYEQREAALTGLGIDMREFERVMLLRAVDRRWMDHIDAMDVLRDGIRYRAYSGANPVTEYQIEAGHMFEELNFLIREDTVRAIYQARVERTPEPTQQARATAENNPAEGPARIRAPRGMNRNVMENLKPVAVANPTGPQGSRKVSAMAKVGRNDPCPCGSGKKFKNCHGRPEINGGED